MQIRSILLLTLLACSFALADDAEKAQKKEMQSQAKASIKEAAILEKSGRLAEAREKYAESQALYETGEATDAIKHLDEEIKNRIKDSLSSARKLYEQHKFKEAANTLEETIKLGPDQSVLAYDLALCYYQLGDREQAAEYLRKSRAGTRDPKQRQRLLLLLAFVTTGENGSPAGETDRERINGLNRLAESIGLEASLQDDVPEEEDTSGGTDDASPQPTPVAQTALKPIAHAGANIETNKGPRSSLCNALGEFKNASAKSASVAFDLANCAETNGRTAEAARMLEKYLEVSPTALDAPEARARIADLQSLLALPGSGGAEIRRLYASAYGDLAERQYDRAQEAFRKAGELAPEFALTQWNLALLYEAMGDVNASRKKFTLYQQLTTDQAAKDEAALHLSTLDGKRTKYDEEIDEAEDLLADLFNRGMNLTFNGPENRRSLRAKRARVKKKEQNKSRNRVGGFAVPYAYAQQQLKRASEHLQVALALFPLGAEANEMMGLVFLQANDGHAAIKSFDAVASQGLPVLFYAEMRGHKLDHAVKCELTRDRLRFIFLSSYDKKGVVSPPSKRAGEDGLGDMTIAPGDERQASFDALDLTPAEIKKVETNNGILRIKLEKQDISLAPIYLPAFTPVEGPPARRFANNYTRLFLRYPGMEDSKLGSEGMTGGEKFKMGYNIATSGLDAAAGGFTLIGAIASVQDAISIARTIHAAVSSLGVSFASWEKSVDDQQRLLAGKSFKPIPVQPVSLVFVQEFK
jgi:tetratricopeptide (TPR) repeat protein